MRQQARALQQRLEGAVGAVVVVEGGVHPRGEDEAPVYVETPATIIYEASLEHCLWRLLSHHPNP